MTQTKNIQLIIDISGDSEHVTRLVRDITDEVSYAIRHDNDKVKVSFATSRTGTLEELLNAKD